MVCIGVLSVSVSCVWVWFLLSWVSVVNWFVGILLVDVEVISVLVLVGLLIMVMCMLDVVLVVMVDFCGLKMFLLVVSRLLCFMLGLCG